MAEVAPAGSDDDVERGVDRNTSFADLVRPGGFDSSKGTLSPEQRKGKLKRHPSGDIIMPTIAPFEASFAPSGLQAVQEPDFSESHETDAGPTEIPLKTDFEKSFSTLMQEDSFSGPSGGRHPSFGDLIMPGFSSDDFDVKLEGVSEDAAEETEESDRSPNGVEEFGKATPGNFEPINDDKKTISRSDGQSISSDFDGKAVMSWQSSGLKRNMIRDHSKMKSAQRMEKMRVEMSQDKDLTSFPEPEFADADFGAPKASRRASVGGMAQHVMQNHNVKPSTGRRNRRASMGSNDGSTHSGDWSGSEHQPNARPLRARRRASIGSNESNHSVEAEEAPFASIKPGQSRRRTSIGSQASANSNWELKPGPARRRTSIGSQASSHSAVRPTKPMGRRATMGHALSTDEDENDMGYGYAVPDNAGTEDMGYGYGEAAPDSDVNHSLELYKMIHGKSNKGPRPSRRASVGHAPSTHQRGVGSGEFSGRGTTAVWDDQEDSGFVPKKTKGKSRSPLKSLRKSMSRGDSQHSLSASVHSSASRSILPAADPFGVGEDEEEVDEDTVRRMVREKMSRDRPRSRKPLYDDDTDSDESSSDDSFAASDGEDQKERESKHKEKSSDKDKKKRSSSKSRLKKKTETADDKSVKKKRSSSKSRLKKKGDSDDKTVATSASKKKKKESKKKKSKDKEKKSKSSKSDGMRKSASMGALQDLEMVGADAARKLKELANADKAEKEGRKRRAKLSSLEDLGSDAAMDVSSRSLKSDKSGKDSKGDKKKSSSKKSESKKGA